MSPSAAASRIYDYFVTFYSPRFRRRAVLGTTLDRVMLGACNGLQPSFVTLVREAHDSTKLDPTPYDAAHWWMPW